MTWEYLKYQFIKFFAWFSFSQQILQNVSWRRRIAAFVRHPGAQWGRPPSPADCNFHSRWFQNAFHELSETPFLLNALPNLRGFRGTLCSSTARLLPCQQLNVETTCCWSLWVGHILLLIFCKLWKGCICVMAVIPIKLESFWEHFFSKFEIPSSGLGEDLWARVGTSTPVTCL